MNINKLIPTEYSVKGYDNIKISARKYGRNFENINYAVVRQGSTLRKDGYWEYEPIPSNRDAEYLESNRYDSVEEAMLAIEQFAETKTDDFLRKARKYAKSYAEKHGVVSMDDIRAWAKKHNKRPEHSNIWGLVFRGKAWGCVGRIRSKIPSNHTRKINEWFYSNNA